MPTNYVDMNADEIEYDGAGFWGCLAAACSIVTGIGSIIGGVAALLTPEPTLITKIAGWTSIVGGIGAISGGIAYFAD